MTKKKDKVEETPEQVEETPKKPPYSIAEGKALTSKKGILGPGMEVTAEHLSGGKAAIDKFVKSGYIVKA